MFCGHVFSSILTVLVAIAVLGMHATALSLPPRPEDRLAFVPNRTEMHELLTETFNMAGQTYYSQPIDQALKRAREAFTQGSVADFEKKYPFGNMVIDLEQTSATNKLPPNVQHTRWSGWQDYYYEVFWWPTGQPALYDHIGQRGWDMWAFTAACVKKYEPTVGRVIFC